MAIEHSDMVTVLTSLQCRTNYTVKKITEYMLPELKEPFYLHIDNGMPQIVIRPAYEVFLTDLASLEGTHSKERYYHNAEMTRFPKRVHKGLNGIHYGLAFRFDDSASVELFINKLISIVKGSN